MNYSIQIMEYQKIINLLDKTPNQPTKFRTKNWVEINDKSHGTGNTNSQITFKTSMLKSSLCDYSDAYILLKGTLEQLRTLQKLQQQQIMLIKRQYLKNCAPEAE